LSTLKAVVLGEDISFGKEIRCLNVSVGDWTFTCILLPVYESLRVARQIQQTESQDKYWLYEENVLIENKMMMIMMIVINSNI
jgi:hypothetical protein